jgi:hypothetical protein
MRQLELRSFAVLPQDRSVQKEKGGLSPSLSRVAGLLPSYDGWSHPIASPRLSIKTGAPRLHRLSHMDERTVTTRAQPANRTLVLTLTAFLRAAATHRHKPCTTCDAAPKQALCLSRRGTTATSTDRGGTGSGENEAQQLYASVVRLLDQEAGQPPRPCAFRHRPGGYPRYPRRHFHPDGRLR